MPRWKPKKEVLKGTEDHLSCDHQTRFVVRGKTLLVRKLIANEASFARGRQEYRWSTIATFKRIKP